MAELEKNTLLDGLHARGNRAFFSPHDDRILGWVKEALVEGDRFLRDDPAFPKIDRAMDYVLGQQLGGARPTYLPAVVINQVHKAIRAHVAALTDIRPLFGFKVFNEHFQPQMKLLNDLFLMWWVNTAADVSFADALKYALVAGAGDILVEYDPDVDGVGDNKLHVRDPRDTLPFRPTREYSLQTWEGVIVRELISVNRLRAAYPDQAEQIKIDSSGKWGEVFTKFRRFVSTISTPNPSTLDGLQGGRQRRQSTIPESQLFRVYLDDRSINETGKDVLMGMPGTNWSYFAKPGERLYPRKRLIVCTENLILYDGPNKYWHGKYPIVRMRLDTYPWQFLGLGLVNDLMPLQDALNTCVNDFLLNFSQWINRGMIADKNAMPESLFKRLDVRKPNWKVKVNPAMGEAFRLQDGPTLPPWSMQFVQALFQKFDELAEIPSLQFMSQLRQMPSEDSIEKYHESMTPGLNLEGRLVELALREMADMLKVNVFQFYSKTRRMLMLGDAGTALQDLDFDPDTLVPSMKPGDKGYTPELDWQLPREQRALWFHRLFAFYVRPRSILGMHSQEEQMKYVQLNRAGQLDFWTLMGKLEIENAGTPPPIPLPVRQWPPIDPKTGDVPRDAKGNVIYPRDAQGLPVPPPMEIRVPETITERLKAQQEMGIGMSVNPAGRKASGQAPPSQATGNGGAPIVRES